MNVAILTRPNYRSQRFLAESLSRMFDRLGLDNEVLLHGLSWLDTSQRLGVINRAIRKHHLDKLSQYDMFVVSDTMQAFREGVDLTPLRRFGKPILHYEVFFAGGSRYWLDRLSPNFLEKYDGYLVVSGINGVKPPGDYKIFQVGLDLLPRHPFVFLEERNFSALIDFPREGYERQRDIQLQALNELKIETIQMQGEYTYEEIERIYRKISVAFVSFPEAFGVPIAQLQYYGSCIASPDKSWVFRHALLPFGASFFGEKSTLFTNNFLFYSDKDSLVNSLRELQSNYDPSIVRRCFIENHGVYAHGDIAQLWAAVSHFS